MPCQGPSRDAAYAEGEKAFEEIMRLLRDKYSVRRSPDGVATIFDKINQSWDKSAADLKTAVQEMIWTQYCCDF